MSDFLNLPSPLVPLKSDFLLKKEVNLWIKREDLIHPHLSGNKWRKLEFNLREMKRLKKKGVLTFGGAYSNHIYATAAAGQLFDFPTIGIIRGERTLPLNPTLSFAMQAGMKLNYVDRTTYRDKEKLNKIYQAQYPDYYFLPEGGTNIHAIPGCARTVTELREQLPQLPDYICLACGTGGTLAGIVTGLNGESKVLGFSVLKGDFHQQDIRQLFLDANISDPKNWSINTDYHFGGYARRSSELDKFIDAFKTDYDIPLEWIYTGKLVYGIFDLIEKGFFPKGSKVVVIHTGGVGGNEE